MARRYFFHIDLVDLCDETGQPTLSASDQADALRHDDEWSALYVDGTYHGRVRALRVALDRVDMVAELRDSSSGLPPYLQISRVRISRAKDRVGLLDKFTIMVRPAIDKIEEL